MVRGSTHGDGLETVFASDATEERQEAFLHVGGDEAAALFGGEDDVDEIVDVGMGH